MDLGFQEIFLIAIIALLVYGGELPGVMRTLGRTVGSIKRSFQDGSRDMTERLDLKLDLMPGEDLPRVVRRAPTFPANLPAPHDVATEDISNDPSAADNAPDDPADNTATPPTGASSAQSDAAPPPPSTEQSTAT